MSAFIRIYTQLGKEHICYANAYKLNTNKTLTLHGDDDCIKHIIGKGEPCNIHIRYEDQEIETECILEGCTLNTMNKIQFKKSRIDIIRYRGSNSNE